MPPCSPPSDPFNLFSITGLSFFSLPANVTSVFPPAFLPVSSLICSLMSSTPFMSYISFVSLLFLTAISLASFCLIWFCLILYLFNVSGISPIYLPFPTNLLSFLFSTSQSWFPLPLICGFPSFPSYLFLYIAWFLPPFPLSSGPTDK